MARTKGRVTEGYQRRLVELVEQCRQRGDKTISVNQLSRELGNKSLASRFSLWKTGNLKSPVTDENFELLSKVDPQGRTPEQLKDWVVNGDENDNLSRVQEDSIQVAGETQKPSLDVVRLLLNLTCGGHPVHELVKLVLAPYGHVLDESGIDFFINHSSAARDQRKLLMARYLQHESVDKGLMLATYSSIAYAINELISFDVIITGDELQWLDFCKNSAQQTDNTNTVLDQS